MNADLGGLARIFGWFIVTAYHGDTEATEINRSNAVMTDARKMKGFVRREVLKGTDGEWMDIIYWQSMADAQHAAKAFADISAGQKLVELVDLASLSLLFSEQVRSYQ